jgi:hypothetical protein
MRRYDPVERITNEERVVRRRKNQSNMINAATAIATPSTRPPDALDARTTRRKTSATCALSRLSLNMNRIAAAAARLANDRPHARPRERIHSPPNPLTGETGSSRLLTSGETIPDTGFGEDVARAQRIGFDLAPNVRNVNSQILLGVTVRSARPNGGEQLSVRHRLP